MFITLYNIVLTFKSANEILKRDHSNVTLLAVLSLGDIWFSSKCQKQITFGHFHFLLHLSLDIINGDGIKKRFWKRYTHVTTATIIH